MLKLICGDVIEELLKIESHSIDVVVTSPPYNLDIKYNSYKDNRKTSDYLEWVDEWGKELKRVLKPKGSFFLNIGDSPKNPWISADVSGVMRKYFILQNKITWVKAISIGNESFGHYKPVNSKKFLNNMTEMIFHFTPSGETALDRLAIGVPYKWKSNIKRWGNEKERADVRCRGNTWFIPYQTIQRSHYHPATFPVELPLMCIKLHGLKKDMVVLDPFTGSGTSLLACKQLGISGIGIDIDESYIRFANENIET